MDQLYKPNIDSIVKYNEEKAKHTEDKLKNLIHFNVSKEFDKAVWGIDLTEGEYFMVIAPEKQRKTTVVLNWVLEFGRQLEKMEDKYHICIDTLESGMNPSSYTNALLAILATQYMIFKVFNIPKRFEWPNAQEIVNHPDLKKELFLSKKFLKYGNRSSFQLEAENWAKKRLGQYPISLFGSGKAQGSARKIDKNSKRWLDLIDGKYETLKGKKHKIFITDNIQQISGFAGMSFSQLETVVGEHSDFVGEHGIVCIDVSQVSLGSRQGDGELNARGGSRGAEEANGVFQTSYDRDKKPYEITIETPRMRDEPPPTIYQPIERFSGAFLGEGISR